MINQPEEAIGSLEIGCAKNVSIQYGNSGLMLCRYRESIAAASVKVGSE